MAAALELFAERGHRGTSMKAIAERVGMTQPGVLHHFASKEALLLEVMRTREENTAREQPTIVRADGLHFEEVLTYLARTNRQARVEQLLLTTLAPESIPDDHPLHDHFVDRYRRYRHDLAGALRAAQESGVMRREEDPDAVAGEIIATLDGLHLQWLLDPDQVDLEQALRTYGERLSRTLSPG